MTSSMSGDLLAAGEIFCSDDLCTTPNLFSLKFIAKTDSNVDRFKDPCLNKCSIHLDTHTTR